MLHHLPTHWLMSDETKAYPLIVSETLYRDMFPSHQEIEDTTEYFKECPDELFYPAHHGVYIRRPDYKEVHNRLMWEAQWAELSFWDKIGYILHRIFGKTPTP